LTSIAGRAKAKAVPGLLDGLAAAPSPAKAILVRVLAVVGGDAALAAVRRGTADADAQVKDAALRALADWPDPAAAPDLLAQLRTGASDAPRAVAFRGVVRMAREMEGPPEPRLKLLSEAYAVARSADERKQIIGALGDIPALNALRLAARSLDDPALADEAGAAVVKIAAKLEPPAAPETLQALRKVRQAAGTESIKTDAARQLKRLGAAE
jgi:hypothetical protein